MSALENDLPVARSVVASQGSTGDEQAALSPASIDQAEATDATARGSKDASESELLTEAEYVPARTLKVAPEPNLEAQAIQAAAQVHAVGSTPSIRPEAKAEAASTHEDSPAPILPANAAEDAAQGNNIVPPVAPGGSVGPAFDGDGWGVLRIWAEMYFDVQKARISCSNRIERGQIVGSEFAEQLATLKVAEDTMKLGLTKAFRRFVPLPIRDWQKASPGIGELALARLLGHLHHPAVASPYHWEETPDGDDKRVLVADEPYARSLRQLWAYCGHGDATRKRTKGMEQGDALAMGSPMCKMIVHELLAVSCVKAVGGDVEIAGKIVTRARSPYRDVYEQRREATADREGWTPGHQHNDALRITGKEILRDLWVASRMEIAS